MRQESNHSIGRRLRISAGLSVLFLAATTIGCETLEYRADAVGPEGEIVVVTDSMSWAGPIGEALKEQLSPWIGTLPAPERLFRLRHVSITSQNLLSKLQRQKNIVFAAPLSDSTVEAGFLRSRLDEDAIQSIMDGSSAVVGRRDLWRNRQQVYYVLGQDEEAVVSALGESGEDMRYAFNLITKERVARGMFKSGRQRAIEDTLMEKHDFAVNAQHDYFVAIDTTNFVWLRRVVNSNSWRSLFVYYTEDANPASLTPEWIYEARQRLTETWITGNVGGFASIDFRRELVTENIDFLGRFGYETRGLWHMIGRDGDGKRIEYGMGGPFVTYSFYDQDTGRIYMIDGMVFAPRFQKREFLRHMEIIAHTFRTKADQLRLEEARSGS